MLGNMVRFDVASAMEENAPTADAEIRYSNLPHDLRSSRMSVLIPSKATCAPASSPSKTSINAVATLPWYALAFARNRFDLLRLHPLIRLVISVLNWFNLATVLRCSCAAASSL